MWGKNCLNVGVFLVMVFVLFSWVWLGERLTWNVALGFGFICFGAFLIFYNFGGSSH